MNYTRYMGGLLLTDGVLEMAEQNRCYWLLDIIASYQPKCRKDPMLRDAQFWTLKVNGSKAVVTCDRDAGNTAIKQRIPYTDCAVPEIKVWVELGSADGITPAYVALLPEEH